MTCDLLIKGGHVLVPAHTLKAGVSHSPRWGTRPRGWLPARA